MVVLAVVFLNCARAPEDIILRDYLRTSSHLAILKSSSLPTYKVLGERYAVSDISQQSLAHSLTPTYGRKFTDLLYIPCAPVPTAD